MSDVTEWTDRTTCILIGDEADAAAIEACDGAVWEVRAGALGFGAG